MTSRRQPDKGPDKETLLMMLSAYLDGELPAEEEAQVLDALSQDAELLEMFEAMSAARLNGADLTPDEASALAASVLAQTAPGEVPATADGALFLSQLAADDALPASGDARLAELAGSFSPEVVGFMAAVEVTQAGTRAVAELPGVAASLRSLPDHVDARVAAAERSWILASAACDGQLTPAEEQELAFLAASPAAGPLAGDPDDLLGIAASLHTGEALRAAADSPAFTRLAARAGEAALQALEAEARNNAAPTRAQAPAAEAPGFFARIWMGLGIARAPLALAGAAAAVFFVMQGQPTRVDDSGLAKNDDAQKALFDALAKNVLTDAPVGGELPLLADNSADVEAIDATGTTVVFATESSNITVIWVGAEDEIEEQGT